MRLDSKLKQSIYEAVTTLYSKNFDETKISVQKTRKEFDGDYTVVVFGFLAYSRKSPEQTAQEVGEYLKANEENITDFNVVKGFLNLSLVDTIWLDIFKDASSKENYGFVEPKEDSTKIVIEYSSPNTNKPLHLGHVRNNLLGWSLAEILKAAGNNVTKVNLVNDRGIHICKSMIAWKELADGETPETNNTKGDHLVGKYYVLFDKEYKKQQAELIAQGKTEKEAADEADWMIKARKMLRSWERENRKIRTLWKQMNDWVYAGFDVTYAKLGIDFDKIYYESDTYFDGKRIVLKALQRGDLKQKEDSAIYIDLAEYGMDQKVLLRGDGTTVYMTQDIGTAVKRYEDYEFDECIYVVGNEQDYHFKVLAIVLDKLEYPWSNRLTHESYGMVELPEGKMKSREGTVVDADDLMDEMIATAAQTSKELGKLEGYSEEEAQRVFEILGLGALKFFMLKVDAKKNMLFDPKESIDFNGNTGPFVQYAYARIQSLLRKADTDFGIKDYMNYGSIEISAGEKGIIKSIYDFPEIIQDAGKHRNPGLIANYVFDLVKTYNRFYHEVPILKEENEELRKFRLALSFTAGQTIKNALGLLGIAVPERM